MLFIDNYFYQIVILVLVLSSILVFYLNHFHHKIKVIEDKKLFLINEELQKEKKKSEQLKTIPSKIKSIEKETQQKIQNINLEVQNLSFSLREIFNS